MTSIRRTLTQQIARTTKGSYYRALYQAQDAGILPAGLDYSRFVCLATARTGSTLLMRSLDQNPTIRTYGEVVRNQDRFPQHIYEFVGSDKLFEEDPRAFLESRVFRRFPASVKAVGFKIFYRHAPRDTAWGHAVWDYLLSQPNLRFIHLKRANLLHAYISRMKANESSQWIKYDPATGAERKLALDCQDAIGFFARERAMEEEFDQVIAGHLILPVRYEDLAADFEGEMRGIQEFLGVVPVNIEPATKQRPGRPLADQLANYGELEQTLVGTEWAGFLDESL